MQIHPKHLMVLLPFAVACGPTTDVDDASADEDPVPPLDMLDMSDTGWCCACDSQVGESLSCTPASADMCNGDGVAWCVLDEHGATSDCAAQCSEQAPTELCCSCRDESCYRAPVGKCVDPMTSKPDFYWHACESDDEHACLDGECGYCCTCDSLDEVQPTCGRTHYEPCYNAAEESFLGWCQPDVFTGWSGCEASCAAL